MINKYQSSMLVQSPRLTLTALSLTMQRGQIHSPLGISGSGGLRQWIWYDEGHESQQSSSPPSLQTRQNSMWWSSSSMSPASPLSSSPSEPSSLASHWMPSFSCNRRGLCFLTFNHNVSTVIMSSTVSNYFNWCLIILKKETVLPVTN